MVHRSLAGTALTYLSDECRLTTSVGVRSLRSQTQGHVLLVAHIPAMAIAVLPRAVLELVEQSPAAAAASITGCLSWRSITKR